MKICILGKYPPIEGGVSTNTYWLSRGLAERGHEVHVVTNGDEVEEMFRLSLEADDWPWYEPRFERGSVRVYNPDPFSRRAMGHIPEGNPFVSKLAALATDVIRRNGCEVILAYYYEPYGVAGHLASRWTGVPLVIKHAGSDLDRLFLVPDLSTTYKELLRSADAVVTQTRMMPRFWGLGVRKDQLEPDVAYSIPPAFCPEAPPLDVERCAARLGDIEGRRPPLPFDRGLPTIGVYGKIGTSKGTFDLIAALGALAGEGRALNLLALVGRAQGEALVSAVRDAKIEQRTYILPMLPNWRVPSFVRTCDAVCFLERDFPIAIHGPIIPREVLACGTCLILSDEIAAKQRYRERLVPGENVLIVQDPKDHAELAGVLRSVVTDRERIAAIGRRGLAVSRSIEDHRSYAAGWEHVFAQHARSAPAPARAERETLSAAAGIELTIPDLVAFLRRRSAWVDDLARSLPDGEPRDATIRFCEAAGRRITRGGFGDEAPKLLAALRYARARVIATYDPSNGSSPAFAVSDRLLGQPVSRQSAWELRPVRGSSVRIEEFEYDVSALFGGSSLFGPPEEGAPEPDISKLEPGRVIVLFQRSVNLIPRELRIDEPTREIVRASDGTRTTAELVAHLQRYLGAEAPEQRAHIAERMFPALDRLYQASVLVFGEKRPGWGWTGGLRCLREGLNGAVVSDEAE